MTGAECDPAPVVTYVASPVDATGEPTKTITAHIDAEGVDGATITFYGEAEDMAGNRTNRQFEVWIDSVKPGIAQVAPVPTTPLSTNNENATGVYNFEITDCGSITEATVIVDDTQSPNVIQGSGEAVVVFGSSKFEVTGRATVIAVNNVEVEGYATITVRATDNTDNVASQTYRVNVDTKGPELQNAAGYNDAEGNDFVFVRFHEDIVDSPFAATLTYGGIEHALVGGPTPTVNTHTYKVSFGNNILTTGVPGTITVNAQDNYKNSKETVDIPVPVLENSPLR